MSTLTAKLFWKPIRQLKLGWQAAYAQRKFYNLAGEKAMLTAFRPVLAHGFISGPCDRLNCLKNNGRPIRAHPAFDLCYRWPDCSNE
ncbi:MAG: hypothetical protein V6Z86_10180 [Hyphomicrobiales bacterium]